MTNFPNFFSENDAYFHFRFSSPLALIFHIDTICPLGYSKLIIFSTTYQKMTRIFTVRFSSQLAINSPSGLILLPGYSKCTSLSTSFQEITSIWTERGCWLFNNLIFILVIPIVVHHHNALNLPSRVFRCPPGYSKWQTFPTSFQKMTRIFTVVFHHHLLLILHLDSFCLPGYSTCTSLSTSFQNITRILTEKTMYTFLHFDFPFSRPNYDTWPQCY